MGPSGGTVDLHGQSHPSHGKVGWDAQWIPLDIPVCPMGQWDRTDRGLRWDSRLPWTVASFHGTVGWDRQLTPMESLACPMGQWDRTDSGTWGVRWDSGKGRRVGHGGSDGTVG